MTFREPSTSLPFSHWRFGVEYGLAWWYGLGTYGRGLLSNLGSEAPVSIVG
jgi:hypothetical protein